MSKNKYKNKAADNTDNNITSDVEEVDKNSDTATKDNTQADIDMSTSASETQSSDIQPKTVTTLDDIADLDKTETKKQSDEERIREIMARNSESADCKLDKKKDEKLKNIMTYATIPCILVSIGFSLFNIGRVRYTYSFLALSIGLGIMSVFYFIRRANIKKCDCPVCRTQATSTLRFGIIWAIIALALFGAFIYFLVNPQPAPTA